MYGLDTIHKMNNESDENATDAARARTSDKIREEAREELRISEEYLNRPDNWQEPITP